MVHFGCRGIAIRAARILARGESGFPRTNPRPLPDSTPKSTGETCHLPQFVFTTGCTDATTVQLAFTLKLVETFGGDLRGGCQ